MKKAFTLAEVLITLGIIGIVAAMTIPTLMTKYAKQRTETQLVKFYSMMNQTLRMSVAENGDPDGWIIANKNYTYDENVEFLNTYIFPYMKHLGYEECSANGQTWVCVTLMDGGVTTFSIDSNGGDITYYNDKKYVNNTALPNVSRHKFRFQMAKISGVKDNVTNSISYIEPYIYSWKKTKDDIINNNNYGCKPNCTSCGFCTKMIQMNSWKIPSNYPW
ncbi:MAG: type II secretion system GspH family protein [Candidatus Gastranaerophilales bacterium]|nr:type II secretion system GspH family protein [Candidatus Gastranaerophilales bacterium]